MSRFEPRILWSAEGTPESGISEGNLPATPPAEAKNTDTKQEHMIPKSRLDKVSRDKEELEQKLTELLREKEERDRAAQAEEEEKLRKAGELQQLLEREAKKREEAEAKQKKTEAELAEVRRLERVAVVCNKVGYPVEVLENIKGQTEEEMAESAKAQLAVWDRWFKRLQAPPTEGGRGTNGHAAPPQPPEDVQRRFAQRYKQSF